MHMPVDMADDLANALSGLRARFDDFDAAARTDARNAEHIRQCLRMREFADSA